MIVASPWNLRHPQHQSKFSDWKAYRRQAINWSLFGLWEKGRFTDLWLRYFPISPF